MSVLSRLNEIRSASGKNGTTTHRKKVEEVKEALSPQVYVPSISEENTDDGEAPFSIDKYKPTRKDIERTSKMTRQEALALVGQYYTIQRVRKGMMNKISAHERMVGILADEAIIRLLLGSQQELEEQLAKYLHAYAKNQRLGRWMLSIPGVGGVIASGMMAHVNFDRCCCSQYKGIRVDQIPQHTCEGLVNAGHLISFAGQCDPNSPHYKWGKGQIRPYNMGLKQICWNLGQSFIKQAPIRRYAGCNTYEDLAHADHEYAVSKGVSSTYEACYKKIMAKVEKGNDPLENYKKRLESLLQPDRIYIKFYFDKRNEEQRKNDSGENADAAHKRLQNALDNKWKISPLQQETWKKGKLQDEGLNLRATRYAVRLFLNHFFEVGKDIYHQKKVVPYVFAHLGHSHYIAPPNWPCE